jgi:hypothetical protein
MSRRTLTILLALAALVRIPALMLASMGFFPLGEGRVQLDLAGNILEGRGFQLSRSMLHPDDGVRSSFRDFQMDFYRRVDGFYGVLRPETPTTFLVPGNALFFAGLMGIFGRGRVLPILAVQLLLGVLTVNFGIRLAGRFLKDRWLTAAGALMALDPFEIYYEAVPATQALFSLVFLLGLLLSVRLFEKPGPGRGIAAGAVWGLAFLVRPAALPFAALATALLLVFGRPAGRSAASAGCLALSFLLVLLPWGLRNRAATGEFSVMPTQGGVQLWEYNGRIFSENFRHEAPGATLLYGPIRERWMGRLSSPELAEFPDFTDEDEAFRDSVLTSRQLAFLGDNPAVFAELVALRFLEFFKPFPLNEFSAFHTAAGLLFFFWVAVFMVPGGILILGRKDAPGLLLSLGTGGYVLMHLLVASGTPHRVAVDFPLLILSLSALRLFCRRRAA